MAAIENKPQYERIYQKLGLGISTDINRMPTEAQMNDKERINDSDIALGLSWYAESQDCSFPTIEALSTVDPEYQIFFAEYQNETADLISEIVRTKPTWGYINQRLMAMKIKTKEAGTRLAQNVKSRLLAQHEEEVAEATENTIDILNLISALTTKQAGLVRSQKSYLARSHTHNYRKIRVIKCSGSGRAYSCTVT